MPKLSLIVPVHDEELSIVPFYQRTRPVLESLGVDWELVFVNNCSKDASLKLILGLREKNPRVKVITLSRDFGYHAALVAGLSSRESDLYAVIDVDCEDPPEMLEKFHAEIRKGAHTVYGIRSQRDEPPTIIFFRWLFYWINRRIADAPVMLWMAEFSMITRAVRDAILANKTTFPFLRAEMGNVGLKMAGLPYFRARRQHGVTHYNLFRMIRFAIGGFMSSSTFPLRFAAYFSVFLMAAYVGAAALFRLNLSQAAQLAAISAFFYLLVTIPTASLYLARTYKDVSSRPVFFIDPDNTYLS
ncbi:MAG: glycosyltransferase family 2 protein [Elusimicrobia bacterium]|nr:glycosyltransferase family 2 protein [Elusimicrobiota bacterium]